MQEKLKLKNFSNAGHLTMHIISISNRKDDLHENQLAMIWRCQLPSKKKFHVGVFIQLTDLK